jgi:predicted pore-forming effector associated with SMODS systems
MHPYAADSEERRTVPLVLAVAAILSAYGLSKLLDATGMQDHLWWVEIPSVAGFYGLYWKLFDKWIWKWKVARAIHIVRTPYFAGDWEGEGVSSYVENGQRKRYSIRVHIEQEWTKIQISARTQQSRSESLIGSVIVGNGRYPTLSYEYQNQPGQHAAETMHAHPGMTRLELIDLTTLDGEYYTGRDRQNYGTLHLRKSRGEGSRVGR